MKKILAVLIFLFPNISYGLDYAGTYSIYARRITDTCASSLTDPLIYKLKVVNRNGKLSTYVKSTRSYIIEKIANRGFYHNKKYVQLYGAPYGFCNIVDYQSVSKIAQKVGAYRTIYTASCDNGYTCRQDYKGTARKIR